MKILRLPSTFSAIAVFVAASSASAQTPPPPTPETNTGTPTTTSAQTSTSTQTGVETSLPTAQSPETPNQPRGTSEQPQTPPPPVEGPPSAAEKPKSAWFVRPSIDITADKDDTKWKATLYGFAELDVMHDSTRSFGDSQGVGLITRDKFASTVGRTQFTTRNSRLGIKVVTPVIDGIKSTGVLEFDFMANPGAFSGNNFGAAAAISEASYYNNGVFRTRHAYVKVESDVVDVLAGQTYFLFGNQAYFFPCATEYLPLPNMVFGRTTQFRISKTIKTAPVNVDIGIAAQRPPQRDAELPDGQGALRLAINDFKAMHTPGSGGTTADAAAIGVSGSVRKFKVNGFANGTPTTTNGKTGWGVALDALIPIIPAKDANDREWKLTLNGEFTTGTAYADLLGGTTGGAGFPTIPAANPMMLTPPPAAAPFANANVDAGMVTYDANGVLHTIDWQTVMVGGQFYLPPSGRLFVSFNYTHGKSGNIVSLAQTPANVIKDSTFLDGNVFFDVTPAVRLALSYHVTHQHYGDDYEATNKRVFGAGYFFF